MPDADRTEVTEAQPTPDQATQVSRRDLILIPAIVAVAFLLENLDSTVIATSLPAMADSLGTTAVRLNLAITSYVLSLAVFIPISGWIADRYGAKRVFCASILIFTAASAVCGAAGSLPVLLATRIFQGFGGAMMTPVGRLILLRAFPKSQLAAAMQIMTVPVLIGPAVGPLLGGLLTTYLSWRWVFYVNIPVGVTGLIMVLLFIPDVKGVKQGTFDVVGFLLSGFGLAAVQLAIENFSRAREAWLGALFAIIAAVLLLTYGWHARRHANAALDLKLFRIRALRIGVLAGGVARFGINAVPFVMPLLFQLGFGYTALQSGSMTFVTAIGSLAMKSFVLRMLRILGFDRLLLTNALICALCVAGFALFRPGMPIWFMVGYIIFFGSARTVQFSVTSTLSYSEVPSAMLSRSVSLVSVAQQITSSFGIGMAATILSLVSGADRTPDIRDFQITFLLLGLTPLLSMIGLMRLTPQDGAAVSGHVRRGAPGD